MMFADNIIIFGKSYSHNYLRGFSMKSINKYRQLNYNAPTNFQLFENGGLYYQYRNSISIADYLNAIKTCKYSISNREYKLWH